MILGIRTDLFHHALYSAAATIIGGLLVGPVWEVPAAVLLVGALKELVWDWWLKRGHPGWDDMLANVVGVAAGGLVLGLLGVWP